MTASRRRAFVLGGGVAGIAAAFELLDRGFEVELLEAHRWLGGRAFSLPHKGMRERPDNGPHVMLGCYSEMRRLLRRLGTEDGFRKDPTLRLGYRDADGRASLLRLGRLPAPLALPLALLRLRALALGERLRALRGLVAVLFGAPAGWSVEEWIRRRRQQGGPRRYLWDPMCRAILNAEPDETAADLFLSTLRQAFFGGARSAAIWLPDRPWSELIGEPAERRLREAGATVSLGARVVALDADGDVVRRLCLTGDDTRSVGAEDLVVSALPWHAFDKLAPGRSRAADIAGSPLVSVYFEFDDPVDLPDDPLIALVDGEPFHFLYRRPSAPKESFALLSGGGRAVDGLSVAEIERAAREQIARHFPTGVPNGGGLVRVSREARATLLAVPGVASARPAPGPVRGLTNLRVCGDWTQTGLPSTLEGAARSARHVV